MATSSSSSVVTLLLGLMIAPFYLVFVLLFLGIWLIFTITGIGPLIHYIHSQQDKVLLESTLADDDGDDNGGALVRVAVRNALKEEEENEEQSSSYPTRHLAVRWSPGKDPTLPPVCIPNGLGATVFSIACLHDVLVSKGYPVLSYDRAGVGLSDPLPACASDHSSPAFLISDLKFVMNKYVPAESGQKWILLGPSMGAIVCQCFIAAHPSMVAGFVNHDGLPYPFAAKRAKFVQAAGIYQVVSKLMVTGFLRPFLWLASLGPLKQLATPTFPIEVIKAQMNESRFYSSLAREMITMMDLTDSVSTSWGKAFDLANLPPEELLALSNAKPTRCGDAINARQSIGTWTDLPRAASETGGSDWIEVKTTRSVIDNMEARAATCSTAESNTAVLPCIWPNLVVRVMSARDYNFFGPFASNYYDKEMQAWSAAEHSLHTYLARDGARTVFPTRNHTKMFFDLPGYITGQVDEVAAAILKPSQPTRSQRLADPIEGRI